MEFTNKPTNLKFYYDEEKHNEIEMDESEKLVLIGAMSLEDVKEIKKNIIYWDWPMETGDTPEQIAENDIIDSEFLRKNYENENFSDRKPNITITRRKRCR